ncbi:MAG TPA: hypothetical protein VK184_01995 [Nostocaceae cyanobacterium]|nr:hypothetical protein [Nostocaceae cyanobacterium]
MKLTKIPFSQNSSLPPQKNSPRGVSKVIFIICLTAFGLSVAALLTSECNPVSLQLKAWGLEYQLQKGGCENTNTPSQK